MESPSPLAAASAALAADRAHADPAIRILRLPDAAVLARAAALEAEQRCDRPLWGVPFAVKDNIDIAGLPTTAACPGYSYTPTQTAPAVQRLLGTDTAGSGRVPAMFGHIVGLKPSLGSVSTRGVVPACRSIDTISLLAGTVDAALAVARVIAGWDAADPYSRAAPFPHLRRGADGPMRVASGAADGCAPEQARLYHGAAARLGAEPVDIAPLLAVARLLYDGPWVAERTAALRATLAVPGMLHPATRAILQGGLERRTVDAFDAFHQLAGARRFAQDLFGRTDALLLPPRRARQRWRSWRPTRSAPTPGSAPGPTSSTCATWPPGPCPPASAATGCPAGSRWSAPPGPRGGLPRWPTACIVPRPQRLGTPPCPSHRPRHRTRRVRRKRRCSASAGTWRGCR